MQQTTASFAVKSCLLIVACSLIAATTFAYSHADTLRGSDGRGRDWWNVLRYDLNIGFDTATKSISGSVTIEFRIIKSPRDSIQIDLQEPLVVDSVSQVYGNDFLLQPVSFAKEGNVYWVYSRFPFRYWKLSERRAIRVYYHGRPRKAVNPPWDGGFSWTHDGNGKPWIAVSCQGLGASVWWPCKDAQWDEPDNGMNLKFAVPAGLKAISNGRLDSTAERGGQSFWHWHVSNPINNYDATFYIGDYTHWHDTLMGEKGRLDLDYWVLRNNEEKARKQFAVVKPMLHCFEYWMGPYPFYEDGYKLVDAPYLGMEHQGAIAYGNDYKMGYKGVDRTNTGIGMNFDYIVVHESGHEWFGNNVTAKDIADNWIHESITTYSESLFTECLLGTEKGKAYCRGEWNNIENEKPIIGDYGVNNEGSNDMYDKGAAIMYMIRQMTGDDEKFRKMLRGLGKEFYHQVVTTQQVESYIAKHTGLDLAAFFDQYLRTEKIPQLEYYVKDRKLNYRFNNTVAGFTLPLTIITRKADILIKPTAEWQQMDWNRGYNITLTKDFLFSVK
jgi:aminopeptidase N